jgi:hypothetical protein
MSSRSPPAPARSRAGGRAGARWSVGVGGHRGLRAARRPRPLSSDAWLTMPPEPYEYQGPAAIAAFLRHRAALRGAPLRLVPTRANTQPAFGCYLPCAQTPLARPYGMIVLTLTGDQISAITWFSDSSVLMAPPSPGSGSALRPSARARRRLNSSMDGPKSGITQKGHPRPAGTSRNYHPRAAPQR